MFCLEFGWDVGTVSSAGLRNDRAMSQYVFIVPTEGVSRASRESIVVLTQCPDLQRF